MKLAIINYGMGNLASVRRACTELGASVQIAEHPDALSEVDRIILPGVGGFAEGAKRLHVGGWKEAIYRQVLGMGKPLLGICLGMQLLADSSEEGECCSGLSLIAGQVQHLNKFGCDLRVPHVGWNDINLKFSHPLFAGITSGTDFYFVHSYAFKPAVNDCVTANVYYGSEITAAVISQNIFGVQFHPEKSSKAGRRLLQNFLNYVS